MTTIEIGGNLLCAVIVVSIALVLAVAAWRGGSHR